MDTGMGHRMQGEMETVVGHRVGHGYSGGAEGRAWIQWWGMEIGVGHRTQGVDGDRVGHKTQVGLVYKGGEWDTGKGMYTGVENGTQGRAWIQGWEIGHREGHVYRGGEWDTGKGNGTHGRAWIQGWGMEHREGHVYRGGEWDTGKGMDTTTLLIKKNSLFHVLA